MRASGLIECPQGMEKTGSAAEFISIEIMQQSELMGIVGSMLRFGCALPPGSLSTRKIVEPCSIVL